MQKPLSTFTFTIALVFFSFGASGQQYLIFKKRTKLLAVYESGDHIRFKLRDQEGFYNDLILRFYDGKIKFRHNEIELDEIEVLYDPDAQGKALNNIAALGIKIGVGFLAIDLFNQGVVNGQGFEPHTSTLIISGAFISTALVAQIFQKKKYKIDGLKYRLELTDFVPGRM